jgi:hypothetical protein
LFLLWASLDRGPNDKEREQRADVPPAPVFIMLTSQPNRPETDRPPLPPLRERRPPKS